MQIEKERERFLVFLQTLSGIRQVFLPGLIGFDSG
jgi:hypothetical protein